MRARIALLLSPSLAILVGITGLQTQTRPYDLLIRNARVVDGTGSPWFRADIGISGDTIANVASTIDEPSVRVIDVAGQVVAPGFIDLHVHAASGASPGQSTMLPILEVPTAENYIRQGVTTLIAGPDGFSPISLRTMFEEVRKGRISPNLGAFIGHGTIRDAVIGSERRAPTAVELERMRELVRQAMRDGAFGLSTGLFYVPSTFATTEEVIELAKVAGSMGGIHISHMRDEAGGVVRSVQETIRIGEDGSLPTQVTHHKAIGKAVWGKTVETLNLIDAARARGVDVTIDVYPYTAAATSIEAALLPVWAQEGAEDAVLRRLRDPITRRRILVETTQLILEERGGGDPHNVQISRCEWKPDLDGKRLDEVAAARGLVPSLETAADSVLWLVENGGCGGIYHAIDENDVQRVLKHPASMIASDGAPIVFGRGNPHPRSYGTFARVLGRYVRELKTLSLEEAVRKMTAFPAQRIGLQDRGVIRRGMKADLAVFDPASVRDTATFERPHQYAEGFSLVIVNGEVAYQSGAMTNARPGRILYGAGRLP